MAANAPIAGGVLTIIGGAFVTLVGLVLAAIGTIAAAFVPGFFEAFLFAGLVIGILLIVMGILAIVKPEMKTVWGVFIVVLAFASLPTTLGGVVIGFLLCLIGGILVLVHTPVTPMAVGFPMGYPAPPGYPGPPLTSQYGYAQPGYGAPSYGQPLGAPMPTVCPSCGGAINPATRTCMACGRSV